MRRGGSPKAGNGSTKAQTPFAKGSQPFPWHLYPGSNFGTSPKLEPGRGSAAAEFREAVIRIAEKVKEKLGQERVQLSFSPNSGFVYYEPEETGGLQRFGDC